MANRVTIYGKAGDKKTELLRREMNSLSMTYNFYDIVKNPAAIQKLSAVGEDTSVFPKVEVTCAYSPGSVFLSSPDVNALRDVLFAEEVFGITSYWI